MYGRARPCLLWEQGTDTQGVALGEDWSSRAGTRHGHRPGQRDGSGRVGDGGADGEDNSEDRARDIAIAIPSSYSSSRPMSHDGSPFIIFVLYTAIFIIPFLRRF